MTTLCSLATLALAVLLCAPIAAEEERLLYSWTSEDGVVNYTDDFNRVPASFRENSKTFVATERVATQPAPAPATTEAADAPLEQYDGWVEAEWRGETKRLDDTIAGLAPKVSECAKDHVNLSPGDGSRKRREEEEQARECAEARANLSAAHAEREALSERAHRAGAPPGWVRGE